MLALPPSGRRVPPPPRTLLLGHRSYRLIRQSRVALLDFGLVASFVESLQVATSPCCYRDSPDVISANPSPDAWSRTPAGPTECIYLFLPLCHRPSPCRNWVGFPLCSANTTFRGMFFEVADISLCSGLRVCSPPRSLPPLQIFLQGSRGFYIRAYRASLPPHAPGMLSVRIQAIDRKTTFAFLDSAPSASLIGP